MTNASPRKPPIDREPRQQNQRQVVSRQPTDVLRWKSFARYAGHCKSKVPEHRPWRRLVDRHIRDSDRAFLLVRPRVALKIIVQRFVATVEAVHLIAFFETANQDGHSVPHRPDESLG